MKKTNSWNRLLSLALCICMVLSLLPASALSVFATEDIDRDTLYENTTDAVEGEVCAHAFDSTTGKCGMCQADLAVASLTAGETVTYYTTADGVFAAAKNITGSATITILADARTTDYVILHDRKDLALVVEEGAVLTLGYILYFRDPISGGGTIAGEGNGDILLYDGGTIDGVTVSTSILNLGGAIIGGTFSRNVDVERGQITGGTFTGTVTNEGGQITGGIFHGEVINEIRNPDLEQPSISGGIFNNSVSNEGGLITGGTFNAQLTNSASLAYAPEVGYVEFFGKIINTADPTTFTLGEAFVIENMVGTIDCASHIWKDGICRLCGKPCAHTGGEATCTEKAVCDICGISYGKVNPDAHSGGTATCTTQAVCETCGASYGEVDSTNHDKTVSFDDNGFCPGGCYEEAVWNEEDGVYEISNAGQLYWYAQYLNTTNAEIYAELTADILIPENAPNWEPINASYAYFNGNFHTISGLKCIGGDAQYVGLFGMEGWWYEISNLRIDSSYFEGSGYVGAVVACMTNGGSITNCAVTNTTVQGDGDSVGTLAGYLSVGSVVNCFVDANTLAGGYTNGYATIENSYYLSETETEDGGKTAEQFASGEVAYLLQSGIAEEDIYDEDWNWIGSEQPHVWGQTVGQDAYPILKGQKVYENLDCAGAVAGYANEIIIPEHSFVQGYCQVCGEPLGDAVLDGVTYVFGGVIPLRWYLSRVEVPTYWVAGDGYVYFDPAAKLLTLDNATVYSELWSSEDSAVYWEDDLVINFSGTNTMSANDHNNGIVILVKGAAVMNGIGKDAVLHINSGADEAARFGSLTVNSGSVSFVSKDSAHTSAGVSTVALTVAEGAVVNVTAGNANSEYGLSYGMATEKLHVDGTLNASYGFCVNEKECLSCGVLCTELTGSGTINALMLQMDQENMILNFTACGKAVLASNWKATTDAGLTVTNIFTVAEGAILTIPEGVTLDLTEADFTFAGTVINHGIILLPADFALDDAPKSGTIRIGEKGYIYDSVDGKWYCTEDGHIGGTATCTARAVCETCGASYGELDPANHDKTVSFDDNGFCPNGCYEPATLNADDYYEISNAGQLYWFAAKLSYDDATLNGILTADIVVNRGTMTAETTDARVWIRIMARYNGTFDGNNKTISGLYFNDRDATYVGLFSFNQGTVKNVGVINSYFGANGNVGSIAGYNSGTVTNCYSTGTVSGNEKVSGVVGHNTGTVTNCHNTGTVSGSNNVGGVVGDNTGTVTNCHNTGSVSGSNDVGGVVGNNAEIVTNCNNTGSVNGNNDVGGVAGNNDGTVTNCYNTGSVNGNEKVGGVAGYNDNSITDCYSIGSVSGTGFHIGGVVGYSEFGTMTNCYNTGAVSGSYNVGSVVGDYNFLTLKNCYYLSGCATDGSGVTQFGVGHQEMGSTTADDPGCVDARTANQFASGEVAYLLGEAFGQTIGAEDHPILGGKKVYQVTNCKGETAYSNTEENGAHTEQTVTGKAPTCTEPGLTDGMICAVCGEMLVAQKVIPATGHSYDSDVCTVCGHIGVPVKLDSASLSFKEKIHYNIFFYLGVGQTVELADMGLILFDSLKADGTVDDAIAIYSGAVQMDGKYMVATDGIHAKRMGDTIYFRVYAKLADGSYVYSKTVEYSAVTYAQHILKGDYSDSDKALVVAMLNYGAQAQRYFGYNTENPVNAGLTEEQQALVKGYESDLLAPVQKPDSSKTGAFASTGTGFAKKAPAVSFEGSFLLNYFFTPSETVAGDMTLYYWTEADYAAATELTAENATGSIVMTPGAQYHGVLDGIYAKDADATVYVAAVYSDGTATHCTGILPYSIGAYLTSHAAKETNFRAMAQAAAVYCSYCKEYFKG